MLSRPQKTWLQIAFAQIARDTDGCILLAVYISWAVYFDFPFCVLRHIALLCIIYSRTRRCISFLVTELVQCVLVFAPCSSVWAASCRYRCATPAARLRLASPASHSTGTPQPPPPLVLGVCPHSVFPACSCTRPRYTSPDSPPTPPAPHAPSREKYRTIIQDLRLYCPLQDFTPTIHHL